MRASERQDKGKEWGESRCDGNKEHVENARNIYHT
jgi:hypothetical protein